MKQGNKDKDSFNPPKYELEGFARCILPAMLAFYESEEGQREFQKWKEKREE